MKGLNPQQLAAALHVKGPALVVAGAGSGKTRVLTYRITNLVEQGHAFPGEILALTFTNKAAKEMRERVRKMLTEMSASAEIADQVFLSTFHSAGVKWLRRYAYLFGLNQYFTIFDDQDQTTLVKEVLKEMGLTDEELTPKFVLENIDRLKNDGIDPAEHAFLEIRYPAHREKLKTIAKMYERKKHAAGGFDFGDLLLKTLELLEKFPEVRAQLQKEYQFILVDEYQDTNAVQYKILKLLSEAHQNLFVVGDEDQSIYRWRGADIRNIREFEKDFPSASIYKLEENYRSTQNILDVANAVIAHNPHRREKHLFTQTGAGELVQQHVFGTDFEEARWTGKKIAKLIREGAPPADIAILYRGHAMSRLFEDSLRIDRVPYIIYGGYKFYERAEIKDALAYMRLLVNSKDDIAFLRIVNSPPRGIGPTSVEKVREVARGERVSAFEALALMSASGAVSTGATKKYNVFLKLFDELQTELRESRLSDFYAYLLDHSGYREHLTAQNTVEAQSKLENLEELRNVLMDFETQNPEASLAEFLQDSSLSTDFDRANPESSVQLMTLHSAKGLEFPHVFVVALEEGVFPSSRSLGFMGEGEEVDEERRLFYVGVTRAEKDLNLTYAKVRRVYGRLQVERPSRFLSEVPKLKVEITDHSEDTPGNVTYLRTSHSFDSSDERSYYDNKPSGTEGFWSESFEQAVDDEYKVGAKVEHPEFGTGVIRSRTGAGEATKVQVEFRGYGTRKFLTKFAKLRVIESTDL